MRPRKDSVFRHFSRSASNSSICLSFKCQFINDKMDWTFLKMVEAKLFDRTGVIRLTIFNDIVKSLNYRK